MKRLILFTVFSFSLIFSGSVFAQKSSKSENIKVWGNCGMCKKTIESAAMKGGAKTAVWDEQTKVLAVSYSTKKTDATKIQEAIAATGYDTQDITAPDEQYKNLHACCQYDRKESGQQKMITKKSCCDNGKCTDNKACCSDGKCEKDHACCK